jgi:transposase
MSEQDRDKAIKEAYVMFQGGMSITEVCELLDMDEATIRREWIKRQFDLRGMVISHALKQSIKEDWESQDISRGDLSSARLQLANKYGVSVKTVIKYTKEEESAEPASLPTSSNRPIWVERSQRAEELVRSGQATWGEINKACGHDLKSEWIRHKIFGTV